MNLDHSQNLTVADPELQIRGGWGGPAHPDPEVRGVGGGGGGWSQFGQFGLNMRAGGGACWVVPAFP